MSENLNDSFRKEYSYISWKEIAGFRDIAAHKYQTLHMGDVYETISCDFPKLKTQLHSILDQDK
ncbi:MAG: DUF86 domain-containing protein [Lachnospiraceae bacterium]|nr:DUF86 domain-containing protein [Lachnospiraceae bacterium]